MPKRKKFALWLMGPIGPMVKILQCAIITNY